MALFRSKKASSNKPKKEPAMKKNSKPDDENRDIVLTHQEAEAGSPDDVAACGEEDPGAGLESLVTKNEEK